VAHIARRTARVGVALPWHPAADAWLGAERAPVPALPSAPSAAPTPAAPARSPAPR